MQSTSSMLGSFQTFTPEPSVTVVPSSQTTTTPESSVTVVPSSKTTTEESKAPVSSSTVIPFHSTQEEKAKPLRDFKIPIPHEELKHKRLLGQGFWAWVYLSHWEGREVATKIFSPTCDVEDIENTENEQEMLEHLTISGVEGVVKYIGFSIIPDYGKALIMEYVSSQTIANWIDGFNMQNKRPSEQEVAQVLRNTGRVIYNFHERDCIHADINDKNFMLDSSYKVISIDWGFGRKLKKGETSVKTSKSHGTLPYMAPEIFTNHEFSKASDVYAYGSLVYSLTHDYEPFNEKITSKTPQQEVDRNLAGIRERVLRGERAPISPTVNSFFRGLITRCWDEDPKARPTMLGICEELSKFIDDLAATSSSSSSSVPIRRP